MAHRLARKLLFLVIAGLVFANPARAERVVYLGGGLTDAGLLTLTTTIHASGQPALVLLDSVRGGAYTRSFLDAYAPDRIIPVGSYSDGAADLERRLDRKTAAPLSWQRGNPHELWKILFPRAPQVVVCPAEPRRLLFQAACLAGALQAPLFVTEGQPGESAELHQWLEQWQTQRVFAVGSAHALCRGLGDVQVTSLKSEEAVKASYLRTLRKAGPITTLVVANPVDVREGRGRMSSLAPWVALQHHAALVLTNPEGDNVDQVVQEAVHDRLLRDVDTVILTASLEGIPMKRRPNPIPGDKDQEIELEPLTPTGNEPFTFAVGRLFNDSPGVVLLQQARQRLLAESRGPRKALVASNPGGGLPLVETFSRNTAKEFQNVGYQTNTLFEKDATKSELRRLLPECDIFLWEGHHNTLIRDWEMPEWDEPLRPSLVFLQSCLALMEAKAQPLIQRGAVGVIGTSTRTYSGSGGAISLAFFEALLYEDQSLGGSLRQAKNFLMAYSQLKEKRLGEEAKRMGANQRAAWAFTLWGDPTLHLPRPEKPAEPLPPIRHEVHGNTITVTLPAQTHDKVVTAKYQAAMAANARLAGLVRKHKDEDGKPLIPLVFAEVHLPQAHAGATPRLSSRLPSSHYVFCWDARRRSGYLLVTPRAQDEGELRFHVRWETAESVEASGGR